MRAVVRVRPRRHRREAVEHGLDLDFVVVEEELRVVRRDHGGEHDGGPERAQADDFAGRLDHQRRCRNRTDGGVTGAVQEAQGGGAIGNFAAEELGAFVLREKGQERRGEGVVLGEGGNLQVGEVLEPDQPVLGSERGEERRRGGEA